jgi:putative transposase
LKTEGVIDILIACVDDLKGFSDTINTVYPQTQVQLCIVHMVRNSLKLVPWKDYKAVTSDLKQIYQSVTEEEGLMALDQFEQRWDSKHPSISPSWRSNWQNVRQYLTILMIYVEPFIPPMRLSH